LFLSRSFSCYNAHTAVFSRRTQAQQRLETETDSHIHKREDGIVEKAEKKAANCLCPGKKVTFATLLTGIYFITILVIISFFPNVQPSPTIEVFNL